VKPSSSRSESSEIFLYCVGFQDNQETKLEEEKENKERQEFHAKNGPNAIPPKEQEIIDKMFKITKMNRIVDYFAKRPQVQERLNIQIVEELQKVLGTKDVACVIDAKHLCVNSRGIRDIESSTVTAEFGGKFKDDNVRREFLDYIKMETTF